MKMLFCIFLVLILASGCVTPPPETITYYIDVPADERQLYLQPLTAALVEELNRLGAVSNFQYYLSDPLVLISEGSGLMRGSNRRGTLELTTDFARDILIINANTVGEVLDIRRDSRGRMFLDLSFEPGTANTRLSFAETGVEGYFYLQADNGLTVYDNRQFLVQDNTGGLAHLLIGVETRMHPITPRRLPGREIAENRSSSPADFPISGTLFRPSAPDPEPPLTPAPGQEAQSQTLTPAPVSPAAPAPDRGRPASRPAAQAQPELFTVQVGAFVNLENAEYVFERLIAADFAPAYERQRNYYRVVVPNVTPAELPNVTRRLMRAGFPDVWVR